MNTVIHSNFLEESEGAMGIFGGPSGIDLSINTSDLPQERIPTVLAGTYACRNAFKILKILLNSMFQEVVHGRLDVADAILSHFYRWLRSPSSKL
eukprot:TRINITY_DN108042_c0_g1_i1.p1 TRINITY_DN108042_c0_g1~~TRINITY_DN108042_c0_g1_i1.p1  ORF type:complete len:110 (+),score=3.46 TRINITY_DN108042_c0_g1_i1:47-331(+)